MASMQLIDAQNAEPYLRQLGWIENDERVEVQELGGGVSNVVLHVARPEVPGADFVLKQARPQLRTPDPWFCDVERIWREVEVLAICQNLLTVRTSTSAGSDSGRFTIQTPRVLHVDRQNYAFAMTAAPRDHRVWKQELLARRIEPGIAEACGELLGYLHGGTWHDAEVAQRLDDRQIFVQLRLDPYYRAVAREFPSFAAPLDRLCESVWKHRQCMVHADFSPKNLLIYPGGMMMLDFETGHYGDPAFDLGFFLSHLVLKAVEAAPRYEPYLALTERFWRAYREQLAANVSTEEFDAVVARAIANFAGCAWARLDGTSKIDYLDDPRRRHLVRTLCQGVLEASPAAWDHVLQDCRHLLERIDTSKPP